MGNLWDLIIVVLVFALYFLINLPFNYFSLLFKDFLIFLPSFYFEFSIYYLCFPSFKVLFLHGTHFVLEDVRIVLCLLPGLYYGWSLVLGLLENWNFPVAVDFLPSLFKIWLSSVHQFLILSFIGLFIYFWFVGSSQELRRS